MTREHLLDPRNAGAVFDLLVNMRWPRVLEDAMYIHPELRLDTIPAPPPVHPPTSGKTHDEK